jgi:SAM-dependent methyltransferase
VEDAHLRPGEVVVDLGCGTGVECFIAAKEVGGEGRAIGVDMSDAMLDIARRSQPDVQDALGYANTAFLEGYLEAIPLADKTADLVISNCVVNLNHHKRRVFQEIFRILKPGGRLVISDVVTETEPPVSIRGDHQLIGECIGGAMVQDILFAMLRDLGFVNASILKRFPYRTVQGHRFYSLTFCAWRPTEATKAEASDVLYAGPFRAVVTEEGVVLPRGASGKVHLGPQLDTSQLADAGVLVLDPASGAVKNAEAVSCCACALPQTAEDKRAEGAVPKTGCLVCGAPLVYPGNMPEKICVRCGVVKRGNAVCEKGHFVCDACHIQEPQEIIRKVCATTGETDMVRLLRDVRSHAGFPIHGPEHHALVPGVILACYRNLGGEIADEDIFRGIEQGALVPGGSCAFMGICGAAVGVGIAFAVILGSTPLTPKARQDVQRVVSQTIGRLAGRKAARCCQRESFLALKEAARRSEDLLPVALKADERFSCEQYLLNQECIKAACPLYPAGSKGVFRVVR